MTSSCRHGGSTPDGLAALIWRELSDRSPSGSPPPGLPRPAGLTGDGLPAAPGGWPFLRAVREVLAGAPFISVVVCTRDRPEQIKKCLNRLAGAALPAVRGGGVDNAPDL